MAAGNMRQAATLFAFTVNYIFGAGVLGIPYAIAEGGILASCVVLILSSFICLVSMVWIIECQERANLLRGTTGIVEYSKMCRIFLSRKVQIVYDIALTVFVFFSSWMYASIASISLSKTLPILSNATQCDITGAAGFLWTVDRDCYYDYLIYLGIFSLLMFGVLQIDFAKMQILQITLTCIGLSAIVIMIVTVFVAMPRNGLAEINSREAYFDPTHFGSVFATFVFSQLCTHGVPLLSSLPENKNLVRGVFILVIGTTTVLYLLLGISSALFFGNDPVRSNPYRVNKLITLNWQDYTAETLDGNLISRIVSYYVRLYPAVTCSAAFPLYSITLGNGWESAIHSHKTKDHLARVDADKPKTKYYIAASIPSIVAAALLANVTYMLIFIGVSAFVIAFFIPPFLQIESMHRVPKLKKTRYSWEFSKTGYCYACVIFASVALVYTVYSIIASYI
mmetsp:Transcript_10485/g.22783  ORF Transcript_10485/g.22783 Transcript_10485/m.22783 type:complete len:452 (-) Transcript_10485:4-1359(-)